VREAEAVTPTQLPVVSYADSAPTRATQLRIKTLIWIREYLALLLDLVEAKKSLKLKTRDFTALLGINNPGTLANLGKLLALLERAGLAICWNGERRWRPKRYTLVPKELWRRYVEVCGKARFRCETDGSVCGLIGVCPYWRLIEYLRATGGSHG
jgi:hypothetical protein